MAEVRKCKSNTVLGSVDIVSREAEFFPNGRGDLRVIAKELNVSAPTARKILALAYPGRVVFRRGRRGGTHLLPVGANVSPEVAAAEPDKAPRKQKTTGDKSDKPFDYGGLGEGADEPSVGVGYASHSAVSVDSGMVEVSD